MKQAFKQNYGIKVDYYVLIHFKQFKRIVDQLGDLEIKVGKTVSDYRGGKYVTIKKGKQMMDADDVLWYVRSRKTSNDFDRNVRQQEVLFAIYQKMVSLNALKIAPDVFKFYKRHVETDMEMLDVIRWLPFAVRFVNNPTINRYYIGPKQAYDWITPDGAMVLVPIHSEVMKIIKKSQNLK